MKPNVSHQRIAAAFTRDKRSIALKAEDYICHALKRDQVDPAAAVAAVRVVQTRMGPPPLGMPRSHFGLEDWLRCRGYPAQWAGSPVMRAYRLRWLDVLIKEFSS